jgi:spermidine synthase
MCRDVKMTMHHKMPLSVQGRKTLPVSVFKIAFLLFGSGACALVYQVVWLRELRLVFGASTAAAAAVLAIFMGGLGLGGIFLGRRADFHQRPLLFYANLELLISGSALLTPFLMVVVRQVYIWMGGSQALGPELATLVRLILSALILGVPTFLMGGTLPAAARAVEIEADVGRRRLAMLYGLNTLGAVIGVVFATFFMIEIFGTRNSLFLACLLNGLIAVAARVIARSEPLKETPTGVAAKPLAPIAQPTERPIPPGFVFLAAGILGFVFMQMELIWYRLLGPLLGGSTYTLGLILAMALLGIGLGGSAYALRSRGSQPTLRAFALTCGVEACFMAVPYALGDRVAVLSALLHPIGQIGLGGQVIGWFFIAGVVVFPAAVVSGYQFPLLIGLLGRGEEKVGRHTGQAYASNTGGAIAGSLAGGFILLPLLTATGSWKLMIVLLSILCGTVVLLSLRREKWSGLLVLPAGAVACALLLLLASGPTAAWRHSPIGAGRADLMGLTRNGIEEWIRFVRRTTIWNAEGREVSLGLSASDGLAFVVNGKIDGNAKNDAPTQVMLGLVSAVLHPGPKTAMVIGMGTGSSAGWLADIESIKRVDVSEIEPDVIEVARRCAPVNRNVLKNPKVNIIIADAREILLTSREKYDLIVSEPSNPYRAGVASLFTREFYQAVADSLTPGGMFSQWLQAYEVDTQTIRTIYATLVSIFPYVETWQTMSKDLLLVCSMAPPNYPVPQLRRRLASEPFRTALMASWAAMDLEGFLSRFVARAPLALLLGGKELRNGWLNTDDRMLVEFGFARAVGRGKAVSLEDLFKASIKHREHRPMVSGGEVDWDLVDEHRLKMYVLEEKPIPSLPWLTEGQRHQAKAYNYFLRGRFKAVLKSWKRQSRLPEHPLELAMIAEALANESDRNALELVEKLRPLWPGEADAVLARFYWRTKQPGKALKSLEALFSRLRYDPWTLRTLMNRSLYLVQKLADENKNMTRKLHDILSVPFSVRVLDHTRLRILFNLADRLGSAETARAVKLFEPDVPWERHFLSRRLWAYKETDDPMARKAAQELNEFLRNEPIKISDTIK